MTNTSETKRSIKDNELIQEINRAISDLVYDKTAMMKAYNYYHGRRDPEQFRHLEENYGIGTATAVEFVPLVRKHIDVLLGEYLSTPLLPKISCKDEETLSSIFKDKQHAINSSAFKVLKDLLDKTVYDAVNGEEKKFKDIDILNQIDEVKDATERNFISDYEIAGQNIIEYIRQSRDIDFKNELKLILTDLLVSGTCYYKAKATESETSFKYECLNPLNTFIERNPNSQYLKNSHRAVARRYLNKHQLLTTYGKDLTKGDLEQLDELDSFSTTTADSYFRTSASDVEVSINNSSDGILGGYEVSPTIPGELQSNNLSNPYTHLYPVYEVEWLQADKEDGEWITNRYEGVRIGTSIFILTGKVNVIRSKHTPKDCTLSINGMFYSDRNGEPLSLILETANLQDKYDVLCFFRDNVIANSGTVGDWVDVAHLPKFLGKDMAERLMKWEGYAKNGKKLYDSSQEGNVVNTAFNGFDDTIKAQSIQAIEIAIQRVEETCSSITGVFRERLGGIEQRDAVSNIAVGVKNSSMITKQYYYMMDLICRESLLDLLNVAKIVYKNGVSGTIVLGDRLNKIFTALPEYFTLTDFDLHIADSSEIIKEEETIKEITMELTKSGLVDADVIIEAIGSNSLTSMKTSVRNSLDKKRAENNQAQQLSQQVEEGQQQIEELTKAAEQLQQQVAKLENDKKKLESDKSTTGTELEWFKAKTEADYKDKMLEDSRKRTELEALQLIDSNPANDEVRNI